MAPTATKKKAATSYLSLESKTEDGKEFKLDPYSETRAIVYFSHLPNGFFEKELRAYLTQFGAVTNLRVGRSKKTGGSKGYAFAEFRYPEVAKIVVETMNNYLMFDKLVKCEVVPPQRSNRKAIFSNKIKEENPPLKKSRYLAKKQVNQLRTEEQNNSRLKKQLAKLTKLKAKLEEAGVKSDVILRDALPSGKTPVMEVDEDEDDITLKTPPNVRKIKSRSNSTVNTPLSGKNTPKSLKAKKSKQLSMAAEVAERLMTPKMKKMSTPTVASKLATPKNGVQTPKSAKKTPTVAAKVATPKNGAQTPKSAKKTPKKSVDTPRTPKTGVKELSKTPKSTPKSAKKQKTPKSAKK